MEIPQNKTAAIVAGALLLGAGIFIWRNLRSPSINIKPLIGIGQVLAEETAKTLHDRGHVVAVIRPDHQQLDNPLRAQWDAFRQELQRHKELTLTATETVAADPNDPQSDMMACPVAAFAGILQRHEQVDVIVFFMSLPDWQWLQERNALPSGSAKFIVLPSTTMGLKRHYAPYFEKNLIGALITRRANSTEPPAKATTPREWFNNEYQIFTSENYNSLPE